MLGAKTPAGGDSLSSEAMGRSHIQIEFARATVILPKFLTYGAFLLRTESGAGVG
jgi:hypothetical protein